jgi:hypothetical protein
MRPPFAVVAVALFSDVFEYSKREHGSVPWALGPVCYRIHDVVPVSSTIRVSGSLGLFYLLPDAITALEADAVVQERIRAWRVAFGSAIIFEPLERALSIRQPAALAIALGHKDIENRSSKIFGVAPPASASTAAGLGVPVAAAAAASSAMGLPVPSPLTAAAVHAAALDMSAAATTLSTRQLARMRQLLGPLRKSAAPSVAHVALTMAITSVTGDASDSNMQEVVAAAARASSRRGKQDRR